MTSGSVKKLSVCLLSGANLFTVFIWFGIIIALAGFAAGIVLWAQVVILIGLPVGVAALICADRVPRQPTMVVLNTIALLFQGGFWAWILWLLLAR